MIQSIRGVRRVSSWLCGFDIVAALSDHFVPFLTLVTVLYLTRAPPNPSELYLT
jgi:hypothetical protein